ncbi:CopD family protein [Beijerinckia sp. L45]|uniref:CopD family protein n=1 Tax=Beijerinckia sp. L45 TaxID=1641855 RepID=UPI00131E077E|nr:CopD family protein [Beijerinckia sp. L45]
MTLQGALVTARALHFCACAILWGGGGLLWLLRSAPGAGAGPRLLRIAALLAAFSGAAWLAATLVIITADYGSLVDADAWAALWSSSFGPPWAIRLVVLAGAAAFALAGRPMLLPLLTLCGGALALDQAWLGHAATGSGANGAVMIASDALHVTAAYAWTGALPVLGWLVFRGADRPDTKRALALFSTIGILAVAAILATGVINAAFRLDVPRQLIATMYGQILCIKVTLFVAMLGLAWINRSLAAPGRSPGMGATCHGLLVGVLTETAIGVFVLSVAALLGTTAPPL